MFQFTHAVVPLIAQKTFLKFHLEHLFLSQFPFHRTDTESPIFLIFPSQPLPQLLGLWCVKLRLSLEDLQLGTACWNSEFGLHRVLEKFERVANLWKSEYVMLKSGYLCFPWQTRKSGDPRLSSHMALLTPCFPTVSGPHLAPSSTLELAAFVIKRARLDLASFTCKLLTGLNINELLKGLYFLKGWERVSVNTYNLNIPIKSKPTKSASVCPL